MTSQVSGTANDPRRAHLTDAAFLKTLYVNGHFSISHIGSQCGATDAEVRRALAAAGIAERRPGTRRFPQLADPAWLVEQLVRNKMTMRGVSRVVGCSEQTVRSAVLTEPVQEALTAAGWDKDANAASARRDGARRDGSSSPADTELLNAVAAAGDGAVIEEIAAQLPGVEYQTLRRHLNRLVENGQLTRDVRRSATRGRPPHEFRCSSGA